MNDSIRPTNWALARIISAFIVKPPRVPSRLTLTDRGPGPRHPFMTGTGSYPGKLLPSLCECHVVVALRQRLASLGSHSGLVDRGSALHVICESGAGRHQVVLDILVIACSGGHADATGVDSLVIDQVALDADCALLFKVLDPGALMPGRKLLLLCSDPLLFRVRVSYDVGGVARWAKRWPGERAVKLLREGNSRSGSE